MTWKCSVYFDWDDIMMGIAWSWYRWAKMLFLAIKPFPMFGIYFEFCFKKEPDNEQKAR